MGKHGAFCLRAARDCILVNPVERGEMGPDLFRAASSSMRRLGANCFPPFRPNGVTIRSQGTKAPVKTLEAQDRRSPLTTWRMSRIAKGSYCRARCSQKQTLAADSQKRRSPVPFRIASRARKRENCRRGAPMLALYYPNEASYAQPH